MERIKEFFLIELNMLSCLDNFQNPVAIENKSTKKKLFLFFESAPCEINHKRHTLRLEIFLLDFFCQPGVKDRLELPGFKPRNPPIPCLMP